MNAQASRVLIAERRSGVSSRVGDQPITAQSVNGVENPQIALITQI